MNIIIMQSKFDVSCEILDIKELEDEILETLLIKQYRKLSLRFHPDKNNSENASEKFQEIHNAYEYLGKYLGYMDEDDVVEGEVENSSIFSLLIDYKKKIMDFPEYTIGNVIHPGSMGVKPLAGLNPHGLGGTQLSTPGPHGLNP